MIADGDIRLTDADLLGLWEAGDRATPVERALAVAERAATAPGPVADWTVGRRDALLLDLYAAMFGGRIELVTVCPACDEALELAFDTADVSTVWGDARAEHELETSGVRLAFRLPTSADLLAAAALADAAAARRALVDRCVVRASRGGAPVAVEELPAAAVEALAARAAELDPHADIRLSPACAECGHTWSTGFDVADHLWRSIDARARSLLSEVAALATAFGWTEDDVLHLPPGRRRRYLELAGA